MAKGQFLELKDVAHILGCSPVDVVALVTKGKLKAIKKGPYWVFRLSDVASYKRQQTSQ